MPTYAYELSFGTNFEYGYVKCNISPPSGTILGENDTITINGVILYKRFDPRYICLEARPNVVSTNWIRLGYAFNNNGANVEANFNLAVKLSAAQIQSIYNVGATTDLFTSLFKISVRDSLYTTPNTASPQGDFPSFTLIKSRIAPTIAVEATDQHAAISSDKTPAEYFGAFIQGQSVMRINAAYTWDNRDPKLTLTHSLVITDANDVTVYSSTTPTSDTKDTSQGTGSAYFDVGAVSVVGTLICTYQITDSAGKNVTYVGNITVLAYSPPSITSYVVERYRSIPGEGNVPAKDGPQVMITLAGAVSQVANKNAWTMVLRWGETGGSTTDVQIDSDTDGGTLTYSQDAALFTTAVPISSGYTFTVIITDMLGSAAAVSEVFKATCYLDVEKDGIGIGMYTVGTANDKRVDIADDYTLHANGGASFGGNVAVGSGKLLKVYYMRTASRAVAANGYTTYDDALSPGDGWTPLAVVGYYISAGQNYPYTVKLSNSNSNYLDVRLHNSTSTAFSSVYIDVYVLCIRTSL